MGLIEEVRGVLQQSASTDTWYALCDLCALDTPSALYEQLEAYTHDHIKRWPDTILRPVPRQWLGHEEHVWLWKSANCASSKALSLTSMQRRMYADLGIKIVPYVPMRFGERSWLIAQLLRAPERAPELAQGLIRDEDEGSEESRDQAMQRLRRHYPELGVFYQPRQHRHVGMSQIDEVHRSCSNIADIALSQGFTSEQAQDLAFGRTRLVTMAASEHVYASCSVPEALELLKDFTHTRILDLSGCALGASHERLPRLPKLRVIDLSFSDVERFPERLMVPTLCTVTHGPHTLLSEESQRQTRRRVPYVKFVCAPQIDV